MSTIIITAWPWQARRVSMELSLVVERSGPLDGPPDGPPELEVTVFGGLRTRFVVTGPKGQVERAAAIAGHYGRVHYGTSMEVASVLDEALGHAVSRGMGSAGF